jgi:hypothetical protein
VLGSDHSVGVHRSAASVGEPERLGCWARPIVPGRGPKAGPALCGGFFIFSIFFYNSRNPYKFLKYVEITIRLEKYEINFLIIILSRSKQLS